MKRIIVIISVFAAIIALGVAVYNYFTLEKEGSYGNVDSLAKARAAKAAKAAMRVTEEEEEEVIDIPHKEVS